ncbi:MAG: hypothetical protein AMJ54_10300 [Deltaproteobacteria bacterium SG8_13]|nr:MAG: hypothetical protein AMJ54_10300 [Deltaproteobacteria bacterium SG8_13]
MNQLIFKIGLSVETISLYLLCCGLADAGRTITTRNLEEIWNDTPESLTKGLRFLERKNILRRIPVDRQDRSAYQLTGIEHWRI